MGRQINISLEQILDLICEMYRDTDYPEFDQLAMIAKMITALSDKEVIDYAIDKAEKRPSKKLAEQIEIMTFLNRFKADHIKD